MKQPAAGTVRSPLGAGFGWTGLFLSPDEPDSMWIRETGVIELPCGLVHDSLMVEGDLRSACGRKEAEGSLGMEAWINGRRAARFAPPEGAFTWRIPLPADLVQGSTKIEIRLRGVAWPNTLAYLGRVFARLGFTRRWQPYRSQPKNKRLRIRRVANGDETIVNFTASAAAFDINFITRHANIGLNLVGWFRAELGVGESVRCAARAAAAAKVPHALVPLKLFCKAAQGDHSFDDKLQETNPFPVNVVHVDAPQSRDLDHHHGRAFRAGKYTVGYWAWELPEFPDGWTRYFQYVDEVWAPSRFARDSIAEKSPVPVLAMPHAIDFAVPQGAPADARERFGLPRDRFLFLFLYDLNSYQERKNPRAVLRAFREAFGEQGRSDVGLVIKAHGIRGNERDLEALQAELEGLDGGMLIGRTLPREEVTLLEHTCDCFVSLHRSEGFGLAVAEAMFLGKPVISTDWSATAEFVTAKNGCPVNHRLVELAENHGPYTKGQYWADPDIGHAAWHMRRLVEDAVLGQKLGAAAAATIREQFSPERIGRMYAERLRAMALW